MSVKGKLQFRNKYACSCKLSYWRVENVCLVLEIRLRGSVTTTRSVYCVMRTAAVLLLRNC